MKYRYQKSLFVFRRDLRLQDNSGLIKALEQSREVLCLFVLDPCLMKAERTAAKHFLFQSLQELLAAIAAEGGELLVMEGEAGPCIAKAVRDEGVEAVFINADYSPYASRRDNKTTALLETMNIPVFRQADLLLSEPGEVMKQDGGSYTVFTPYYNRARQRFVPNPKVCPPKRFCKPVKVANADLGKQFAKYRPASPDSPVMKGGRAEAEEILQAIRDLQAYDSERDFPVLNRSSGLSPHLRFGTCSVREVYHTVRGLFGAGHGLIRSLYWRDFFYQIAFFYPHALRGPFREKYRALAWSDNEEHFERWCQGLTGYPIVDAGMRELAATGLMHNRVRMIAGSFLVKHLGINWQWGERWFASHLLDFDKAVNNGNWQWVASTGCDAQPWFRIFNPWLQQKKFDPDADYIRRWVPELANLPTASIHNIGNLALENYPSPMVEHAAATAATKLRYARVND